MSVNYLSISQFSEISRCSPKSLRYYESIGALRPAFVNDQTGYRYYNPQQAYQARLIKLGIEVGMPPAQLGRFFYSTDVYEMDKVLGTFQSLAEENYQRALAEKLRVQAQLVEYQRQLQVSPLEPRRTHSGLITHFRLYCADALEEVSYQTYVRKLHECLVTAHELGLNNLAQEGLTKSEADGRWYIYVDVHDTPDLDDRIADRPDLQVHRYDQDEFVTQSVQGASLEQCFDNVLSTFDTSAITCLTELWGFTMLTGVASFEVTFDLGSDIAKRATWETGRSPDNRRGSLQ